MTRDLSWMDEGLCRECDPDLLFTEGHQRASVERRVITTFCRRCPVISECGEYALTSVEPQYGVWGGMAEREIAYLRKRAGLNPGFAAPSWIDGKGKSRPKKKGNRDASAA